MSLNLYGKDFDDQIILLNSFFRVLVEKGGLGGGGGCLVFALLIKLICINLMDDKVTWVCMQPKFVDT